MMGRRREGGRGKGGGSKCEFEWRGSRKQEGAHSQGSSWFVGFTYFSVGSIPRGLNASFIGMIVDLVFV